MKHVLFETINELVRSGAPHERTLFFEEVFSRGLTASDATEGGFTMDDRVSNVADALRPFSAALSLGCSFVTTSGTGKTIPIVQQGAVAEWLTETGEAPSSTLKFGAFKPSAHRCATSLVVSRQLLSQAPGLAEATIRRDLYAAIGRAFDVAVFSGAGGVEPVGVIWNSEIPESVTFGGAPTLAKCCEFESKVADNFGERPTGMGFVTSPKSRSKLRQTEALTGSGKPLWTNDNKILGRPVYATACFATDQMVYGYWPDWLIITWGGIRFIHDPYTLKKNFQSEFYIELQADCGPVQGKSFMRSSDSAAQ